ncbi:unnamed protein product [Psylliodes chrysocephalus]|uniref:HECT domain-containing protein n=1 Tax=Psylliodes chrysocephalus TaxID=3402493 RepID=A0A9P0CV15_9CUCU|nr:unnamed protein product [Psylliodes chrysocephala]
MFKEFQQLPLNVKIKMIATNGIEENGIDLGGILRDTLSEFWNTFFEKCTVGSGTKVPCIRHDFGKNEWEAIAKILCFGYKTEKYFPYKLSKCFIIFCFFNKVSDLSKNFLLFVGSADSDIIKEALNCLSNEDEFENMEELIDIVSRYDSKFLPTKQNLKKLLDEIAHKEFIQKPSYIINLWKPIFKNLLSEEDIENIYKKCTPTFRNINDNLCLPNTLTKEMINTYEYLKEYLRECNDDMRAKFLRFCTGADCLIVNSPIAIQFTNLDGFQRRPISHTCTSTLELPTTYNNLPDFREEFNSILNANFWNVEIA